MGQLLSAALRDLASTLEQADIEIEASDLPSLTRRAGNGTWQIQVSDACFDAVLRTLRPRPTPHRTYHTQADRLLGTIDTVSLVPGVELTTYRSA